MRRSPPPSRSRSWSPPATASAATRARWCGTADASTGWTRPAARPRGWTWRVCRPPRPCPLHGWDPSPFQGRCPRGWPCRNGSGRWPSTTCSPPPYGTPARGSRCHRAQRAPGVGPGGRCGSATTSPPRSCPTAARPDPLSGSATPDQARSVQLIAASPGESLYRRGELAERIAAHARAQGGALHLADLAAHQPIWVEPWRRTTATSRCTSMGFGSGVVVPGTGIAPHNRGAGFVTKPGHPNVIAPGRRPFHTIMAGFVTVGSQPLAAVGVMGGPTQPQGHVQLLLRMIDHGQNPQAAVDAPRWRVGAGRQLAVEEGTSEQAVADLRRRGHRVRVVPRWSSEVGGAQIAVRLAAGHLAASDPARTGTRPLAERPPGLARGVRAPGSGDTTPVVASPGGTGIRLAFAPRPAVDRPWDVGTPTGGKAEHVVGLRKRWLRRWSGAATAGLLLAACGTADDQPAPAGSPGQADGEYCTGVERDLIWAHEQEPPDMHLDDPNNNLTITSWVRQSMLEGLYGITSGTLYYPELLAEEARVTPNNNGTVTINFRLRDGLTWSDGEPLTADNVKRTWEIIMEGYDVATGEGGVYLFGDRTGYDKITDFNVRSDTNFIITFSEFFAGFKDLFADGIFPTHVITDAAAANEAFLNMELGGKFLPASGPMVYDGRQEGVSMHLRRNDGYHGSVSPDVKNDGLACVTGVQINWVADTDAQVNALKAGEADMVFTQPQVAFGEEIATDERFTVASLAGPSFEHWGLNLEDPHLKKPEVREALAYALDKGQIVETLYTPLFGDLLPSEGLGNTYWMSNQPDYEDHQTEYAGPKVDQAKQKLEEAGYTAGSDGVYTHPRDGRLSLRVGTTGGNQLRELQQQIIQQQMKAAGIEIQIDNVPGGDYFTERVFNEESVACSNSDGAEGNCDIWDITQFAWVGGPWPGSQSASYRSGSGNNAYGFNNDEFDTKATECDTTVEDDQRADCYNELDTFVTTLEHGDEGLFMLPITQKPSFYAYSNESLARAAVSPDADAAGPLANVVDYAPAR
ncbi:MAG TPA: ABC transporter substrate-binding protein [Nitriliruptorales bacterium]|nr:ABC transporter substrate-binding protein [Nitriliruptorales bacterium]